MTGTARTPQKVNHTSRRRHDRPRVGSTPSAKPFDVGGLAHSGQSEGLIIPLTGYDKRTMAADLKRLLRQALGISGQVALVGHDIGLMVAYAYAEMFRDEVSHLAVIDAPLPGTQVFDRLRADPRVWQFAFR